MFELRIDARGVVLTAHVYERAGGEAPKIIARALNHVGAKGETQVKRTLARETGAKAGAIAKAMSRHKASTSRLAYEIIARGGAISLKAFGARQTAKGVSAAPWNKRRIFPGTFGPNIPRLGGHVFHRLGPSRHPIEKLWGPSIPREMIRGASFDALDRLVGSDLGSRIVHELQRALG